MLNSVSTNLNQLISDRNVFVAFITYDSISVQFYYYEKKYKDIKVSVMPSAFDPFCPIPYEDAFIKLYDEQTNSKSNIIDKLVEKANVYAKRNANKLSEKGSLISTAIYSSYDLVKNLSSKGNTQLLLFNSNKCAEGILSPDEMNFNKYFSSENEIKLFLPQHNFISNLSNVFIEKRITLSIFAMGYCHTQIHTPTFFELCNLTGGNGFYYNLTDNKANLRQDLVNKLEKLHYDINRVLIRKYYSDVQVVIKCPPEIEVIDILGAFGKKNPSAPLIFSSINPDFNFMLNLRIKKNLKEDKDYCFQVAVIYTDPEEGIRCIRTINYTLPSTDELIKFFTYLDVDCLTKLILMKELTQSLTIQNKNICCFEKIKDNLNKRLVECFCYYRKEIASYSKLEHFTLPSSLRYLPLYFNSFIKKPLMRKIKNKLHPNIISNFINLMLSSPLNITIKHLYPRLYRLDDMKTDFRKKCIDIAAKEYALHDVGLYDSKKSIYIKPYLYPLSLDGFDMDMAFLYDDGLNLNLIILRDVNEEFIHEVKREENILIPLISVLKSKILIT